jgi:hypothetical protein
MSKQILYLVLILFPVFLTIPTYGVEPAARITDREIIEALADLRAGQKALEKRMEALEKRMDGIEKKDRLSAGDSACWLFYAFSRDDDPDRLCTMG